MSQIPGDLRAFRWRIEAMMPHLSDWLSQHDFDKLTLNGFDVEPMVDGRSSSGIILNPNNQWLGLLGILVQRGIVEQKEEDGVFFYRALLSQREGCCSGASSLPCAPSLQSSKEEK